MSYRHSCDRCRQQKVRCLRDTLTTEGQPLPPCERCKKAGVSCIYSLRQRASRPTEARKVANTEPDMSGFGHRSVGVFSRGSTIGSEFGDLTGSMPTVHDGVVPSLNGWDLNLHLFSPISPLPSLVPAVDVAKHRDAESISGDEDEESVDDLASQLTALSQRARHTMRGFAHLSCAALMVSSPQITGAFEDTNTLINIINKINAGSETENGRPLDDDGLVFLALASHQHLLSLFRAICQAISRYLNSIVPEKEQNWTGSHGNGLSSVAQFVMVLQLLMHLINRMDKSFFQNTVGPESGHQFTPITPTSHLQSVMAETEGCQGSLGLPSLAHAIVRAIPDQHIQLRHTIKELQMRIESSEFL